MAARRQAGFTVAELLVSLAVLLVCFASLARMLIQSSQINRAAQATAELQSSARNCLTMVVQRLRSAGWDPMNAGIGPVALDGDLGDTVSEIEVFADLDEDGTTSGLDEQVLIRHVDSEVVWRRSADPDEPFVVLAGNITNDADGDGLPEPMFVPDSVVRPTRVLVRITARSPAPSPVTGEFLRYTIESEVALRKTL